MTRARPVPEIEKYGFLALIGAFALFLILTFIGRDRGTAEALRPPAETPRVRAARAAGAGAGPIAAAPVAPAARTWTVKRGETLASIARVALGNAANWKLIVAANPGLEPTNLKAGQVLVLPVVNSRAATAAAAAPAASRDEPAPALKVSTRRPAESGKGPRKHSVAAGESLRSIAVRYYRDASRWTEILAANRDVLEDPNRLIGGLVLVIP